ncbi:epididymal-specific lipocalin-8 [Tupaia chinensis]|uniref:epididymal-specific lipocalin-8 n=1 Tax=Tupaia chinensis TaxID=246437 RepID=UPI0003C8CFAD|nr:epididymal-specific lipocalin-8 [Tupaia chinensis]
MVARLLSAALGVLVMFRMQAEVATLNLDRQKILGFWREVGVASDQNLVLKAPKRVEGLFLTLSQGNLTVTVAYNNSGRCETEHVVGSENRSGRFTFPGQREILVLDTDYEHFLILRVSLLWRGKHFHVLKYLRQQSLPSHSEGPVLPRVLSAPGPSAASAGDTGALGRMCHPGTVPVSSPPVPGQTGKQHLGSVHLPTTGAYHPPAFVRILLGPTL